MNQFKLNTTLLHTHTSPQTGESYGESLVVEVNSQSKVMLCFYLAHDSGLAM